MLVRLLVRGEGVKQNLTFFNFIRKIIAEIGQTSFMEGPIEDRE